MMDEFAFIETWKQYSPSPEDKEILGIGDDAAVIALKAQSEIIVTKDLLIENIHFEKAYMNYEELGHKSLAVNLSDIAAMGGIACCCFLGLAIPTHVTQEELKQFQQGFMRLANQFHCILAGGDTTRSNSELMISVTVIGKKVSPDSHFLLRSHARPDDHIYVTGCLGDAGLGLQLFSPRVKKKFADWNFSEIPLSSEKSKQYFHKKLCCPVPRIQEMQLLCHRFPVHAAIDISDGLSSDISHILKQSNVGCRIDYHSLPVSDRMKELGLDFRHLQHLLLSAGEDYEILFTSPTRPKEFLSVFPFVHWIGEITSISGQAVMIVNDREYPLKPEGFNHFRP